MTFSINDFKEIKVNLNFEGLIFKSLNEVKYSYDGNEIGRLTIEKQHKKSGEFSLIVGTDIIRLIAKSKFGYEFDFWYKNEKFEYLNSKSIFTTHKRQTYKSDIHKIQYQYNGYGIMIYKDGAFIGRIKDNIMFFTNKLDYSIHFLDYHSVDILMTLCSIEILQERIYKIHETSE